MRPAGPAVALAALLQMSVAARAEDFAGSVRQLNALQNLIVAGDAAARDRAAKQFELVDQAIDAVEPDGWLDERNVRSAVIYLLCGGSASKLREIHGAGFVGQKLTGFLGASLDYAEGREGGVPKALMDVNARDFPPVVGGHLALVQGGALVAADKRRAIVLFDLARLLMPGSLVEEAALRREIALLDPEGDTDKLAMLGVRYIEKYPSSPYVQNFWDALRQSTVERESFLNQSDRFTPLFDKAPASQRLALYLAMARQAFRAGKLDVARMAIEAGASSATSPPTQKRIATYRRLVAALTQEKQDDSQKLDVSQVEKEDSQLFAIVSSVVSRLAQRTQTEASADEAPYAKAETVRRALAASDDVFKRAAKQ